MAHIYNLENLTDEEMDEVHKRAKETFHSNFYENPRLSIEEKWAHSYEDAFLVEVARKKGYELFLKTRETC